MFKRLFLLLLTGILAADVNPDEPVATSSAGPSAFFQNVNLITGDLVETYPLMQFPGAHPFTLTHSLTRYNSVTLNVGETASFKQNEARPKDCHYYAPGQLSCKLHPDKSNRWGNFHVEISERENNGLTNLSMGFPSGPTNPRNIQCTLPAFEESECSFKFPDGSKKIFEYVSRQEGNRILYKLKRQEFPNGQTLLIENGCHMKSGESPLWDMNLSWDSGRMKCFSDDGRSAEVEHALFVYRQKALVSKDHLQIYDLHKWYPTKVSPYKRPITKYAYDQADGHKFIFLRNKDEGGLLTNYKYFAVGIGPAPKSKDLNHRISSIQREKTFCPRKGSEKKRAYALYEFDYELPKDSRPGITTVTDANKNRFRIFYDKSERLTAKEWCDPRGSLLYRQTFEWGKSQNNYGMLKKEALFEGENHLIAETRFTYDGRGNIVKKEVIGAFTCPGANDCLETVNTYSNDGLNLLLTSEENGRKTLYHYIPGTNLLCSKFDIVEGKIIAREFYRYNKFKTLSEVVTDDGSSSDPESLADVTTRLIKRFTPRTQKGCIGLNERVDELYLDLETGSETLLLSRIFDYTTDGQITSETILDGEGALIAKRSAEFTRFDKPTKTVDFNSLETINYYTPANQILSKNEEGIYTTFEYDHLQRKIAMTVDGEHTTRFSYDDMNNCTQTIDPYGNATDVAYDALNKPCRWTFPQVMRCGEPARPTFVKKQDFFGNITLEIDGEGYRTEKLYNVQGKPFEVKHPDGTSEKFRYNLDGTLKCKILRNGLKVEYEYDAAGRPIAEREVAPTGEILTERFKKYFRSKLIEEVDPAGVSTFYTYDFAGRLNSVCREGSRTEFEYDALGRKTVTKSFFSGDFVAEIQTFDPNGKVLSQRTENSSGELLTCTEYRYDKRGNKTHTIVGDSVTQTSYDSLNRPILIVSPEGNATHISYEHVPNSLGQRVLLKTTCTPSGVRILETHDALERVVLTETYSPFNEILQRSAYAYDLRGLLLERKEDVFAEGEYLRTTTTRFEYDSMGNRIHQCEAADYDYCRSTYAEFNPSGEKTREIRADGSELHYSYDALGRLETFSSDDLSYRYRYDVLNRLTRVDDEKTGAFTLKTYDPRGALQSETLQNGQTVNYESDLLGRVTRLSFENHCKVAYRYDALFLRAVTAEIDGKSAETSLDAYDLAGRVLSRTLPASLGTVTRSYDLEGRLLSTTAPTFCETDLSYDCEGNLLARTVNGQTTRYAYDALHQLTEEEGHHYRYDSLHNRLEKDDERFEYDALNRQSKMAYDRRGNLVRSGARSYSYDSLNRLTRVETPDEKITYSYDAFGRLMSRFQNGARTDYLYQGDCEIGSLENGTLLDFRVLGSSHDVGTALLLYHNETLSAPIHDLTGSLRALVTLDGKETRFDFTAFGEGSHSHPNRWLFSSKPLDRATGLYNFGKRHYDPSSGRFLTTDPLGFDDGPNLYAYVHNRPLVRIDLLGLFAKCPNVVFDDTFEDRFPEYERSQCIDLCDRGLPEIPGKTIMFINGIWNTKEDAIKTMEYISMLSGNVNVYGVYNATHGRAVDLVEAILSVFGSATAPVRCLHEAWDRQFEKNPNVRICMIGHSGGAAHFRNGIMTYDCERAKQITGIMIAPGAYTEAHYLKSITHIRASVFRDCVPMGDIFGFWRCRHTIVDLPSHPNASLFDHTIMSPTYQKELSTRIQRFKDEAIE